jgi:hypothetical protein
MVLEGLEVRAGAETGVSGMAIPLEADFSYAAASRACPSAALDGTMVDPGAVASSFTLRFAGQIRVGPQ